jgi:MinD-like ATPase involved in chromosome partitioning or flagellar assembly
VPGRPRTGVLVAAARAGWEPEALRLLAEAGLVVVKRCVDLPDLLATAGAGQAEVAVVAAELVGLDQDAVQRLRRHEVRPLAVAGPDGPLDPDLAERLERLGVPLTGLEALPASVESLLAAPVPSTAPVRGERRSGRWSGADEAAAPRPVGRVVAVWGPAGAPGRTTVAIGLAAERAAGGAPTLLLDLDPYGGAVGQHLGLLDEVSGLLACARLANEGGLDADSFRSCRRRLTGQREQVGQLDVLTGLPRADRWIEVRAGVVEAVLALAAAVGDVVVDCGFSLEDTGHGRLGRNTTTLEALAGADEVVLVGSAEPTGLSRLARGLVELGETAPGVPTRVVVNRMRDTLGWSARDIVGMVEGYAPGVPVHFLPEDRAVLDRALVRGAALTELGESSLRAPLRALADEVFAQALVPAR